MQRNGESLDDLQREGLRIYQDHDSFCFGMDAVLLSSYVDVPVGGKVLDLGTGNAVLPLLLSAKTGAKELVGVEIQERGVELAKKSVRLNGLEERVRIVQGDIREASRIFGYAAFDVVVSNPPYMPASAGVSSPSLPKRIAREEVLCTWKELVGEVKRLLRPKGRFFFVHRTFRLTEILGTLAEAGLAPKQLRFVHPYVGREAALFLCTAAKDGGHYLNILPPLIVYDSPGRYSEEVAEIYGYGKG